MGRADDSREGWWAPARASALPWDRATEPQPTDAELPASAAGAAYDDLGRLHVLADGTLAVVGEPGTRRLPPSIVDHDLRGLAGGDPGELLTYDATTDELLVLLDGRLTERVDAADADLQDSGEWLTDRPPIRPTTPR